MNSVTTNTLNGVNIDQLVGTIGAIQGNADIAQFTFRAKTTWIKGGQSQTEIQGFYGATQEDTTRTRPHILVGDEPAVLLGEDHGPNAVEAILHALSSCLSVGIVYNAAARGIEIRSLNFYLEGDLDLHPFLGLSEEPRPGYKNITVRIEAEHSTTQEDFEALIGYVKKTSPVLDIIANPVPVEVVLE